jgi:2-deoxy-D-gluconate 3-dehydrogenase
MSILERFNLAGKVAMVTGAAQGLGQGFALGLAEAGADVALLDYKPCTETDELVSGLGRKTMSIECDLSKVNSKNVTVILDQVIDELGGVDILVNNAGAITRAPVIEYPEDEWRYIFSVNLDSIFFLSQAAGRWMKDHGGGKIINLCSMLSYQGGFTVPAYASSKSALAGLTRSMANEFAAYGINVNGIAPGYMLTANTQPLHDDPVRNPAILQRIPMGRWGRPDDLKGIVVFLASSASDYMSGSIVNVDGGWMVR